jgi:hypothetical protein
VDAAAVSTFVVVRLAVAARLITTAECLAQPAYIERSRL